MFKNPFVHFQDHGTYPLSFPRGVPEVHFDELSGQEVLHVDGWWGIPKGSMKPPFCFKPVLNP